PLFPSRARNRCVGRFAFRTHLQTSYILVRNLRLALPANSPVVRYPRKAPDLNREPCTRRCKSALAAVHDRTQILPNELERQDSFCSSARMHSTSRQRRLSIAAPPQIAASRMTQNYRRQLPRFQISERQKYRRLRVQPHARSARETALLLHRRV